MLATQQTLYVDHSVVSYEETWSAIEDVLSSAKTRLALSLWNLVEIGSATDKQQRTRRLDFLQKFNPIWIVERVPIQKQEVEAFLWKDVFGVTPNDLTVFSPHLSVVDSYHAGPHTQLGLTASQWIAAVDFKKIEELKQLAPNALKILQAVDSKTFKERQHEIFSPWIKGLIPLKDPSGAALTNARRTELLNYCDQHQEAFFTRCKSLQVEDALTAARVSATNRKPQRSDGIDLMHAVIALAYCDHFLVRDGFVQYCSAHATKALAPVKLAEVWNRAEALRDSIVIT